MRGTPLVWSTALIRSFFSPRGTPGIGKSWFGELLLWVLVNMGVRVVFQQARAAKWLFFDLAAEYVYDCDVHTDRWWPKEFSSDMGAVLIFDPAASGSAVEPLLVDQFTVVTASPNRLHFKEFLKTAGQMRFLPFWSREDLKRILPYCDLPGPLAAKEAVLAERYGVVGGIPRKIFDDKATSKWKAELESQLAQHAGNIRSLLSLDIIEDYNRAHNNLVVIHSTRPTFENARLFLTSDFVREKYKEKAMASDRRVRSEEIKAAWNDPTRAAEAGKKFEPFAFESLFLGGRFPLFQVREDGTHEASGSDRSIGPFQGSETFTDLSEMKDVLHDVLYRPSKSNFPILDFFALNDDDLVLFQMTVSTVKPNPNAIFTDKEVLPLLQLHSTLYPKGRVEIVFVAPDFVLHSFKLTKTGWSQKKKKEKKTKSKPKKQPPAPFEFVDPSKKLQCRGVAFVLYLPVLPVPQIEEGPHS